MAPISAATRLDRLPVLVRGGSSTHNMALCRGWLDWLKAHGRKPLTLYGYGSKCDLLCEFLGDTSLDKASLDQLEAFVTRPRAGRARGAQGSEATRAADVEMLRGLYGWAIKHGRLAHNPTDSLERPRVKNEDPKAIDVAVWDRFWVSPTLDDVERAAFGLGFFCGLRREELARLRPSHVDLDAGRIVDFPRKGDRGKNSGNVPVVSLARLFAERHPMLLPDASGFLDPLKALCVDRQDKEWLIPWGEDAVSMPQAQRGGARPVPDGMTSPDQVNHHLRYALKRAAMPERIFTPHALRHSFVTYLLRAGVALEVTSKLANHSALNVTLRYVKVADDPIAELLESPNLKGSRW